MSFLLRLHYGNYYVAIGNSNVFVWSLADFATKGATGQMKCCKNLHRASSPWLQYWSVRTRCRNLMVYHERYCTVAPVGANTSVFARCCPQNTVNTVIFCLQTHIYGVFGPEGLQTSAKLTPFGALRASPPSSTTGKTASMSLFFVASCFFEILVWWRILHGDASTNRLCYAQQPLHRAAFMRTCSYTERFLHREAFTHTEDFMQRSVYAQKLSHTDALHTDASALAAFTHRRLYTQTLLQTDAFTHTRKLLHREAIAQHTFYTKKFSSPNQKTGKQIFEFVFLRCFLSFPFHIMSANGWHWDIHVSFFVLGFIFSIL